MADTQMPTISPDNEIIKAATQRTQAQMFALNQAQNQDLKTGVEKLTGSPAAGQAVSALGDPGVSDSSKTMIAKALIAAIPTAAGYLLGGAEGGAIGAGAGISGLQTAEKAEEKVQKKKEREFAIGEFPFFMDLFDVAFRN